MTAPALIVSCGVLRDELDELARRGELPGEILYLDSMLHMVPNDLESSLQSVLKNRAASSPVVLVYGDCCANMVDLAASPRVVRVQAINCAQMLIGRARYRELMKAESFLMLPEWALRWREIMTVELGLSAEVARDLMGENRRELVYLDTGLTNVPRTELDLCSAYTGLPWRIETVGLDNLLALIKEALEAAHD